MNKKAQRRRFLQRAMALPAMALPAFALTSARAAGPIARQTQVSDALVAAFGPNPAPQKGRVTVAVPAVSENGYSVPLSVSVESPMTDQDHVRRVVVIAEANPLALVADVGFSPKSGFASFGTRIRLADSQRIYAVAEMSDGSLWSGYGYSVVTLAACVL